MATIRELQEKRANLLAECRAITDKPEGESGVLSAEQETRYNKLWADAAGLRVQIDREEQLAVEERSMAERRTAEPAKRTEPSVSGNPRGTEEYRSAFARFLSVGERGMKPEEQRALSVGSDTQAGFLVASEQFVNELIQGVDNMLWIRQFARKISVPSAVSVGVPTLDADPADSDWVSELQIGSEDSTMAVGKRKLTPHPLSKLIKISRDWLRMASGGESLVMERLRYKFAVTEEKGLMTGTGSQQPLGVFIASNDGIGTARDLSTGNTTTAIVADNLIGQKYNIKEQYRSKAQWVFHRDALSMIAKLKDGNGQYLWRESIRVGEPDTLLGMPVRSSEYAPNTFTTGLYVGLLGDFSHVWIADATDLGVQRLDELYAATNQVGFIGRLAMDGQPVLAEAFSRVKLG